MCEYEIDTDIYIRWVLAATDMKQCRWKGCGGVHFNSLLICGEPNNWKTTVLLLFCFLVLVKVK